jgi:hypothetical protein
MKPDDEIFIFDKQSYQIRSAILVHEGLRESVLVTLGRSRTIKVPNDYIFATKKLARLKRKEETSLPSAIQINDMVLYNTFRRAALPYFSNHTTVLEQARDIWVPALVIKATPTSLTLVFDNNTLSTPRKNCVLISKGVSV